MPDKLNKPLSKPIWKQLSNYKWEKHVPIVIKFLTEDGRLYVPKVANAFGIQNFQYKENKLYLFDREIVTDDKRMKEIIDKVEEQYGGIKKAHWRIMRSYINITRSKLHKYFAGSERRQLKQYHRSSKKTGNFIVASTPGNLQIDLTFYRGQKVPVFGAVDIFSRWSYFERVSSKSSLLVIEAIKRCVAEFQKVSKHKVYNLSSDAGSEFKGAAKAWLIKNHIHYDQQAKSRKMIESLNSTLRKYIERVGFGTLKELDDLIEDFNETYNNSRHSRTNRVPNELVAMEPKQKEIKDEAKRQFNEKKSKMGESAGYRVAKISVSDFVRIYDPRRREIKSDQKKKLKGKIKLNEDDFVKQFTSHHRGPDPDWSKTRYMVVKIIVGKRAPRYKLKGRKETFLRSEIQKVTKVTKKDPRKKKQDLNKLKDEKIKELMPDPVRKKKYLGKEIIIHYNNEKDPLDDDPATVLDVYRDYLIVFHSTWMSTCVVPEIAKMTGKTTKAAIIKTWIDENPDIFQNMKNDIDDEYVQMEKEADEFVKKISKD
jgi:hypothetical protein